MNNNIIQLSSYTAPVIVENNKNEWVEYGADNNYYQFLIDRYSNSATNNAVINNICRLIFGQGLTATDSAMKPNEWAQLLSILKEDDLRRIIFDLYALGQCALQIHYDKGHKAITRAFHTPIQLLRPEKCNQDGDIVGYFYSDNWTDPKKYVPKRFDAFGTSKKEVEILYLAPYSAGMKYFSNVDYQGGIDYAYLEEKIAEYLINEVENSFAPTSIVNFNNGTPTDEMKDEISNSVIGKLTGSKGKKVVISFNENEATKTTIDTVPLQDAADHYSYLSDESTAKILRSHNVTTPLLFGVTSASGFSSNADEMKTGALLFENMVIKPKQQMIVEMINKILSFNGISLKLSFKTLQPLDNSGELLAGDSKRVIDGINSLSPLVANKVLESMTPNEVRSLVGLVPEQAGGNITQMSSEKSELELLLDEFGEDIDENYVLIDERDSDYDNEDVLNEYLNEIENTSTKLSLIDKVLNFVSTGTARPTAISSQDKQVKGKMFKVRYKYTGNPNPERAFCKAMMNANKVYRKEDIDRMSDSVVNRGFGEFGADKYDIFRFHGGPRCHHKWSRLTYMLNDKDTFEKIGTRAAEIRGYKVTNPSEVSVYPNNLPLKGYSPRNKNLPSDVK
jgi:hypothetical protein